MWRVAMIVTMTTLMPMVMIRILTMSVCGCDWDCDSIHLYTIFNLSSSLLCTEQPGWMQGGKNLA